MLTLGNKLTLNSQPIYHFVNKYSIDFDGVDDVIVTDGADTVVQPTTYAFWCKSSTTGGNKGVFGHGGDRNGAFHFNEDGTRPLLWLNNSYYVYWVANTAQDDDKWHQWVVYLDLDITKCKLYCDGVLQTVSAIVGAGVSSPAAYTESLSIGGDKAASGSYFEGQIDEFAVFDRELKQDEITRMYNTYYTPNRVANGNFAQIGNEEVSNGDFSQEGSEEVSNGDFATDTDWDKKNGSTISGGVGNVIANGDLGNTGANWSLNQDVGMIVGKSYKISFSARQTGGTGNFQVGQAYKIGFSQSITSSFENYTFIITPNDFSANTGKISIGGVVAGDEFEIDNVSVKELSPDETGWNYGSNWLHSESIAYSTGANSNGLEEASFIANSGSIYSVTYDIGALTQGAYQANLGGALGTERTAIGTYSEIITASSNSSFMIMANNNAIGAVDNISIIEITNVASVTNDVYSSCELCVVGCTDIFAWNYDSLALADDGSCMYSCGDDIAPIGLNSMWETNTNAEINWSDMNGAIYDVDAVTNGDFSNGSSSWNISNSNIYVSGGKLNFSGPGDVEQNIGANAGNAYKITYTVSNYFTGTISASLGGDTTDLISSNGTYEKIVFSENSSTTLHLLPSGFIGSIDNVSVKEIITNNISSCRVWKYLVRYRAVGDLNWTTKSAGAGSGLCNVGLTNTTKVLRNLSPSTTYEYKMKVFYCGPFGGSESGYSDPQQFTTKGDCPEMTNLSVETFNSNHSKARFTWDTTGAYVFARIALRVDTAGATWQTAGGFGIYYPTLSANKFGLVSGESYRAQGRTFCDANVTSYRSDWISPIFWTQPGILPSRIDGETASINNFDVYPNPSSDIFNISFVSDKIQNLNIKIVNLIGEVIYVEGLEKFVGEYTKQVNLNNFTKGVYFLEITTNDGVVNKKIVLQ